MTARQRGQPLIFLAMVVVLWIGARMVAWNGVSLEHPLVVQAQAPRAGQVLASREEGPAEPPATARFARAVSAAVARPAPFYARPSGIVAALSMKAARAGTPKSPAVVAAGRVGRLSPLEPSAPFAAPAQSATLPSPGRPSPLQQRRWSADAWALVRSGGGTIGAGPGAATYGGNQVGGVLRYRLAPGNAHRPTVYLRATAALNGTGEKEAALGLSARPLAAVPIYVAAEGRVGTFAGRTLVRPAVMAVTEFPPASLPGKARAEFYAQAGYVGRTNATLFADGQIKVDREIIRAGPLELRAGAGAWSGAQRGAARFDVGPSATLGISKGAASARLALDWRFRLAGDARPASGPALTVSAGF